MCVLESSKPHITLYVASGQCAPCLRMKMRSNEDVELEVGVLNAWLRRSRFGGARSVGLSSESARAGRRDSV